MGTVYTRAVLALKALFWGSLGAVAWTHVGYPLAAMAAARAPPADLCGAIRRTRRR